MIDAPETGHDPGASRFAYSEAGVRAELAYRRRAGRLVLGHPGVAAGVPIEAPR